MPVGGGPVFVDDMDFGRLSAFREVVTVRRPKMRLRN
jgi:hypothetical protein